MLTKINKIKYLGLVFRDFTWAPGVAEFKQVNLFYGWNGCGKTTLTRLFDEVAPASEAAIEFELEIADGTMFRRGDAFPHPIRVFNQDYIQKNVRILESRANTISVLLGEQNKELVAQIETNERELNGDQSDPANIGKIREFDGFTQKKLRKEKGNETAFSDIARTIGAAIVGSGSASRTYRSPDAKRDFETLRLPALLPDEALDARILALKQDLLPTLDLLQLPSLVVDGIALPFTEAVATCRSETEGLCALTVEAEMIDRLRDNLDIATWVEQGRHIHAKHESTSCEYCGNTLTKERLSQLARHFSEADQQLKVRIDAARARLLEANAAINELVPPDMARLYGELQLPFKVAVDALKTAKARLIDEFAEIEKALEAKKNRTDETLPLQVALDTSSLIQALNQVNESVKAHNTKSGDFQKVRDEAVRDIKVHYLSTIYEVIA
jgi:wobble nucleotide-excising tRNase